MIASQEAEYYIGTSGWTYDHWKGLYYPDRLPKNKWFDYYKQHFNSVEVNATFYRYFKDEVYKRWKEQVPDDFKYVLKAPKIITHQKYLKDIGLIARDFYKSVKLLENFFGLILMQLAPDTKYDPELLRNAIMQFNDPGRIVVEFRNRMWYTEEIKNVLKDTNAIACNVDSPGIQVMDWVTSEIVYVRLHGRRKMYQSEYTKTELREIAATAKGYIQQGAHTVYMFFNNDFGAYAPENAKELIKILFP